MSETSDTGAEAKDKAKKPAKAKTSRKKSTEAKKLTELKEKLSAVEGEMADLEAKAAKAQKQLLYEQAELENYKRRMEKRRLEDLAFATERIVKDILPVIDNFDRALDHADEACEETNGFLAGVKQIAVQLREALEAHGLQDDNPMGEKFDPNLHEAVAMVPGEKDNIVIAVQEKGYRLKDRLLRPAKVVVSTLAS